ncbi:DUF2599 domain-containing protein [Tissierella sp.]|uniref:DUF2599 domain-containing protein n=1 Tax=Tissierella sp. TaxID=41274 RepID=UPI0028AF9291|nr:DUF2599 domain-containing protein [Tissierella sp.]
MFKFNKVRMVSIGLLLSFITGAMFPTLSIASSFKIKNDIESDVIYELNSGRKVSEVKFTDEVEQLKHDVQSMSKRANNISPDILGDFIKENEDEIEELNERLEDYVYGVVDQYVNQNFRTKVEDIDNSSYYVELLNEVLMDVFDKDDVSLRSGNGIYHDTYFKWSRYEKRNGYNTYSMVPETDVRLFKIMAQTAWIVLKDYYSIRTNVNGLEDQFMCHYYAKIEHEWNIEVERPDVGLTKTIAAFCNP